MTERKEKLSVRVSSDVKVYLKLYGTRLVEQLVRESEHFKSFLQFIEKEPNE